MNIKNYKYYYFIGIGGIGMSALARYFHRAGKKVMGYDKTQTTLTQTLTSEGIEILYEDIPDEKNWGLPKNETLVVYTPAIKKLNILHQFEVAGFPILKRSQVLGLLTKETTCLAVAGTHGKTTTSTLLGHLMKSAGQPCTAFLGGIAENYHSNIIFGGEDISIVEADEFDRSFLHLSPDYAVITSMDADHLDIYGTKSALEESFRDFAHIVRNKVFAKKGLNIPNSLSYAVEEDADYSAKNLRIEENHYLFDLKTPARTIKDIKTFLPGKHNIENAVAAIAIALEMDVSPLRIKEGMQTFKGVKRRFSTYVCKNGKIIIDDYAHHPTEISATIEATKNFYSGKKILGVFQPHLYSRTRDFADDFAKELEKLENLILLDIYPAREEPIEGVTSKWLASKMNNSVSVIPLNQAIEKIKSLDFEVLLLMGAGNIDTLTEPLKTWQDEA